MQQGKILGKRFIQRGDSAHIGDRSPHVSSSLDCSIPQWKTRKGILKLIDHLIQRYQQKTEEK